MLIRHDGMHPNWTSARRRVPYQSESGAIIVNLVSEKRWDPHFGVEAVKKADESWFFLWNPTRGGKGADEG